MKKKLFLLAALSFVAVSYASAQCYFDFGYSEDSVVNVSATATEYVIDFELNIDSLQEVIHSTPMQDFSTLDLPKPYFFDYKDSVGKPMLPIRQINLEVPEDLDIDLSFSNLSFTYDYIDLKKPYYPYQEIRIDTINAFAYNADAYLNAPNWTLDNEVKISPYFHFFDEKGFRVEIHPYSYDPLNNRVRVIHKMQATIPLTSDNPGNHNDLTTLHIFDWIKYLNNLRDSIIISGGSNNHAPILIVTPQFYLDTLETYYKPYRAEQHHIVNFLLLEDIAEDNHVLTSCITPEMIIHAIQDAYDNSYTKPKYLLLIGNSSVIPYASGSGCYLSPYTDYEYSLATHSCGTLTMPLAVGRWPIGWENVQELMNIMRNMMRFEHIAKKFSPKSTLPVDVISGIGSYENTFFNCAIDNYSFLYKKYHVNIYDGRLCGVIDNCFFLNYGIIESDFNNKLWMLIYQGHGSSSGLGKPLCIYNNTYENFESKMPTMIFAYTCLTNYSTFGSNWLKYFVENNFSKKYGAAAYFGATTTTNTISDGIYSDRICENFGFKHLGENLVAANQDYHNITVWRKNEIRRYVLLGDPATHIFGSSAKSALLSHVPSRVKIENDTSDGIQAKNDLKFQEGTDFIEFIYNANGQLVRKVLIHKDKIDISDLPSGIYFVVTYNGTDIQTRKIFNAR